MAVAEAEEAIPEAPIARTGTAFSAEGPPTSSMTKEPEEAEEEEVVVVEAAPQGSPVVPLSVSRPQAPSSSSRGSTSRWELVEMVDTVETEVSVEPAETVRLATVTTAHIPGGPTTCAVALLASVVRVALAATAVGVLVESADRFSESLPQTPPCPGAASPSAAAKLA